MINFSTLQGLTIPEGVVTQIKDASGRVLWKKAPATATITLNGKGNGWHHYVKHNSTIYSNATNTPSFQANIGDVIVCHCMLTGGEMSIYLNGILVAGKTGGTTAVDYSYTVVSDATIELAQSDEYRRIYITEVPENCIVFSISGDYAGSYIAEEGMTWAEWFASEYNTTGETADDVQSISANGTTVALDAIIVGGTAYEVGFGPKTVTITISNSGNNGSCYVTHNGTWYYTATTFTANIGDTIHCRAKNSEKNKVYVNNVQVASNSDDADYDYTVVSDATIRFNYDKPDKTYIYITDANA